MRMKEVEAGPVTKTMNVSIEEGAINADALSKTITIPKLKNIVNVTVNTGTITYSVNGEQVTLNAKNGAPSRKVWNSTKYSKAATATRQTAPGESITKLPETVSYSSDGYTGTLNKDGVATLISGREDDSMSKEVEVENRPTASSKADAAAYPMIMDTYKYNDGTYSGKIPLVYYGSPYYLEGSNRWAILLKYYGTVYATVDTRVYRQNYSGTVYKGDYDNYYAYTVTIDYIDNSNPGIDLTQPSPNSPLQAIYHNTKEAV